jgi:hypothetical protein
MTKTELTELINDVKKLSDNVNNWDLNNTEQIYSHLNRINEDWKHNKLYKVYTIEKHDPCYQDRFGCCLHLECDCYDCNKKYGIPYVQEEFFSLGNFIQYSYNFGKRYFFTEEEAENKLKDNKQC